MRLFRCLCSVSILFAVSAANAAELYVSPTGTATTGCSTRSNPCSLSTGASLAAPGDTVILMDGIYHESLYVVSSGTEQDWITFKADQCATPIIEGPGVGPTVDDQANGIGSAEAEYLRFEGIVARGWNIGFGNGWAGGVDSDEESNGHWEIEHCISYSNGRTGFTFFSAENFTLKHSISAHNGSSQLHSWSSGVTLFEAHGTNLVEGNISFENTDAERNTDGSGFIVDEESNNALFVNNVAFGNAGSCLRLTDSSGTRFINNTCYHNSQFGARATGPSNPSELYFTNAGVTVQGVTFMNNVIVGTGQAPAGANPVVNQPQSGWSNNVVETGNVTFFSDPTGENPDFSLAAGATTLIGQGSTGADVPATDVGFDPKCIVKRTPVMVGDVAAESWWQYDIDIEYIQSIGGVAGCFNPGARAGAPDLGAYANTDLSTVAPESCIPPVIEPDPMGGAGGMGGASVGGSSAGGATGVGGSDGAATDGTMNQGGAGTMTATTTTGAVGTNAASNMTTASASTSAGGAAMTTTGSTTSVGGAGGSVVLDGTVGAAGGSSTAAAEEGGCGCRLAAAHHGVLGALAACSLGLLLLGWRRRA